METETYTTKTLPAHTRGSQFLTFHVYAHTGDAFWTLYRYDRATDTFTKVDTFADLRAAIRAGHAL